VDAPHDAPLTATVSVRVGSIHTRARSWIDPEPSTHSAAQVRVRAGELKATVDGRLGTARAVTLIAQTGRERWCFMTTKFDANLLDELELDAVNGGWLPLLVGGAAFAWAFWPGEAQAPGPQRDPYGGYGYGMNQYGEAY
jgi:hypothetical protein